MAYCVFIMLMIYPVRGYVYNETDEFTNRIYYGFEAKIEQYPHAVFLHFDATTPSSCGGSLIMVQAILTAAHCVDELRYYRGQIHAFLGSTVPTKAIVVRKVVDYEMSKLYDEKTGRHNVAVAFMAASVPLRDNIKKIPLSVKSAKDNMIVYSVGWGKQKVESFTLPDFASWRQLKGTRQRILDRPTCTEYSGFRVAPPLQCAVSEVGHFYKDDSGDGLVAGTPPLLVGVLSFVADGVSIFTDIEPYRDWIMSSCYSMYKRNCKNK